MNINLTTPINSTGYGQAGKNILLAVARLGHQPALWLLGGGVEQGSLSPEETEVVRDALNRTSHFDARAPSLRIWHQFDLAQHVGRNLHAALTFFELDRLKPNEVRHLGAQDAILVSSEWARQIIRKHIWKNPCYVVPLGVDRSIFNEQIAVEPVSLVRSNAWRKDFIEPNATVFSNIGKWEVRKGHDVLCEAFNKAFEPSDNVRLIMGCFNPCLEGKYSEGWARYYENSKMSSRIGVIHQRLRTQQDVAKLMALADCGVFPSRGEAWGLESLEMLSMGKHLITTNYAGHTEYCTELNSWLISIDELEDAYDGVWFNPDDPTWEGTPGRWAKLGESQVDQLVEHLRTVHRLKQEGQLHTNTHGIETAKRYSWEACAQAIVRGLQ